MSYFYNNFTKFMKRADLIIDKHFFFFLKCQLRHHK